MIKLIASDLDGTLVNDQKEFAPDFFDILKELTKLDIKFCVASGRSTYALKKVFSKYTLSNIKYEPITINIIPKIPYKFGISCNMIIPKIIPTIAL